MNTNKLLQLISKDKRYKYCCRKVAGSAYCDDLYQHVILILAEMDEAKLLDIYNRGKLLPYFGVTAYRNYNSYQSSFFKNHRHIGTYTNQLPWFIQKEGTGYSTQTHYKEFIDQEQEGDSLQAQYKLVKTIMDDYDKNSESEYIETKLFEIYVRLGSYRKVSKEIGIPHTTIADMIKRYKERIIQRYEKAINRAF